ncbi:DNA packaging tegument protein UL17 [macacine betaherpesvirus 9]|uniref:DNA packaging tegument protein UL17 n=1 Tax=macacine betaherpesvirus 9 TaxID=2560568 RepID=A0A191S3U0_9BETA|nr:DNA packaging tegument protein UL17 [macacine betaherpesvirus 9]ANC96549.1 DNA packaging tegument protein UL17 [macacine betaherpesvirus 9]
MEMHLLCEVMFSGMKANLPLHLCLLINDTLSKEKIKQIEKIYFQCVFLKETQLFYTPWEKVHFRVILHDVMLSQVFSNTTSKDILNGFVIITVPISVENLHLDTDVLILKIIFPNFVHEDILIKLADILSKTSRETKENEQQNVKKPFFHMPEKNFDFISKTHNSLKHNGPLEPPSTVRGLKQSENSVQFHQISIQEKTKVTFKCDSWFNQNVFYEVINDLEQRYAILVFWYEMSKVAQIRVQNYSTPLKHLSAQSLTDYLDRINNYLLNICERVFKIIVLAAYNQNNSLLQKFDCHFQTKSIQKYLTSGMELARDFWILNMNRNSCVIKGLASFFIKKATKRKSLDENEFFADLIDCTTGKVLYGEIVKWKINSATMLYSTVRKNQNISWELQPNCYALYMSEDLKLYWVIPGGFCISGSFISNNDDATFFDWQFGLP